MKRETNVGAVINATHISPGSIIYCSGNAATPQVLLNQLAKDTSIEDVEMISVLLLGDIDDLFSQET